MREAALRLLLLEVARGQTDPEIALAKLRRLPFTDLGFAKIDNHRHIRCGAPEVIYCEGKTPTQVAIIAASLNETGGDFIATRVTPEIVEATKAIIPDAVYHEKAMILAKTAQVQPVGRIVIISAGTSDQSVSEEAQCTANLLGSRTVRIDDVGIAGLHRLLAYQDELDLAQVIVAVAGMDAALPSVIAGLVRAPVIAVPTSVGYGANLGGITALLSLLCSCAPGLAVVNIDNGFGAGYIAHSINKLSAATVADQLITDGSP